MPFDPTEDDDDRGSDPTLAPIGLDANALDPNGRRDKAIDRFMGLVLTGRLRIHLGEGVKAELSRAGATGAVDERPGPGPDHHHTERDVVQKPAPDFRHPGQAGSPRPARPLTAAQHIARIRVRAILGGNARPGKHEADALHVSEAAEAGCAYFITYDSRILRKRADLRAIALPQMSILTLEEFLALVDRFDRQSSTDPQ